MALGLGGVEGGKKPSNPNKTDEEFPEMKEGVGSVLWSRPGFLLGPRAG